MIHYILGDATQPVQTPALIAHVCNDCQPGKWGAGFVMALSRKCKIPEQQYRQWSKSGTSPSGNPYQLGEFIISPFSEQPPHHIFVANMIGQHGIRYQGKIPPIRYDALQKALTGVFEHAADNNMTVHMPRIGCVLAGGDWSVIEKIIEATQTVDTFVYTLRDQKDRWDTQYENEK